MTDYGTSRRIRTEILFEKVGWEWIKSLKMVQRSKHTEQQYTSRNYKI